LEISLYNFVFIIISAVIVGIAYFLRPTWFFCYAYPALIFVSQAGIFQTETNVGLERVLVIAIIGGFILNRFYNGLKFTKLPENISIPLILWLIIYFISFLLNSSDAGLKVLFSISLRMSLFYVAFIELIRTKKFETSLRVFMFISFFLSLLSYYFYIKYKDLNYLRFLDFDAALKQGFVFEALARQGAGNVIAVFTSIFFLIKSRKKNICFFWIILTIFFFGASLLAMRREVLFMIPVGLMIFTFYNWSSAKLRLLMTSSLLILLGVLAITFIPEWNKRIFVELPQKIRDGSDERTALLKMTLPMVMDKPIFGWGPGNYILAQQNHKELWAKGMFLRKEYGMPAHNSFSSVAVQGGIIALIAMCTFLYSIGKRVYQSIKLDVSVGKSLKIFALIIFVQIIMHINFGDEIVYGRIWYWFAFVFAISYHRFKSSSSQLT
jgi:hypothetical protein